MGALDQFVLLWAPYAGIVLLIGTFIVALAYMFGNLLQNERIKAWAKIELFEIIYSLIIIAAIVMLVQITDLFTIQLLTNSPSAAFNSLRAVCGDHDTLSAYIVYDQVPCHFALGIYFYNTIFREASGLGFQLFSTYLFTSTIADFTINIEFLFEKAGFFTFNPWKGLLAMGNNIKSSNFDMLSKLMIVLKFQEIFLVFIAKALAPVTLGLGIVLRSTAFTRRLGGLLMAIALSLYFVFPLFPMFGAVIVSNIQSHVDRQDPNAPKIIDDSSPVGQEKPSIIYNMYIGGKVPSYEGRDSEYDFTQQQENYFDTRGQKVGEDIDIQLRVPQYNPEDLSTCPDICDEVDPIPGCVEEDAAPQACKERRENLELAHDKSKSWFAALTEKDWVQTTFIEGSTLPGGIIDATARVAFFSLFFSFLGVLATIATVRSISGILGGDLEIAGLTHLI